MPRTVLIVDDERDVNDLLARFVEARDFEAVQRFEGATVIDDVRTLQPDLVLLDLMLPDSDGFAICEKLKRTRETNLTPVVMVTSLNDPDHRLTGVRVGANGYLTKPFTPRQLFDSIDAALAWRDEHINRGTTGEINFDIRSELAYLRQTNDMLSDLFHHTPLTERQIKDLKQVVNEMGGNAIEWGHRKNAELTVRITYRIDPEKVTIIIRDQGPGFNPTAVPHAASDVDPIGHLDIRNDLASAKAASGSCSPRGWSTTFATTTRGTRSPWSSGSPRLTPPRRPRNNP